MDDAAKIRAFTESLKTTMAIALTMTPEAFTAFVRAPDFAPNAAATEIALERIAQARAGLADVTNEDTRAAIVDLIDIGEAFEIFAAKTFELRGRDS